MGLRPLKSIRQIRIEVAFSTRICERHEIVEKNLPTCSVHSGQTSILGMEMVDKVVPRQPARYAGRARESVGRSKAAR